MIFDPLPLNGAYTIAPEMNSDNRGAFGRLFCRKELKKVLPDFEIAQINLSVNKNTGTLRGLHFQHHPKAEIKIVKCIKGAVYDVIVDIRKSSPTFLKSHSIELTENNNKMIYIPKGFAHGFQVLKPDSQLLYFHSEYYSTGFEGALHYNDPQLAIDWPLQVSDISDRDLSHPQINTNFKGIEV